MHALPNKIGFLDQRLQVSFEVVLKSSIDGKMYRVICKLIEAHQTGYTTDCNINFMLREACWLYSPFRECHLGLSLLNSTALLRHFGCWCNRTRCSSRDGDSEISVESQRTLTLGNLLAAFGSFWHRSTRLQVERVAAACYASNLNVLLDASD
jgi:hypothetical protein